MPKYLNEVFELACPNKSRTRNTYLKLICPFNKTETRQNAISFFGRVIWNKTPEVLNKKKEKKDNSINTFKHNLKRHYLIKQKLNYDIITIIIITIAFLIICCHYYNYYHQYYLVNTFLVYKLFSYL